VRPPQPDGVTETAYGNAKWNADTGESRYRRSIYTFMKRTAPFALYNNFDAPTGESCIARREVSNTPLQALALLNDPQFVEASRGFAYRMLRYGADDRARLKYAFRLATAREPDSDELNTLMDVLKKQEQDFAKNASAAEEFLSIGEWKPSGELDKAKLAAWTTVAGLILNLDETVTKN